MSTGKCRPSCLGRNILRRRRRRGTTIKQSTTKPCAYLITNVRPHDDVIKWKHFPRYWPFVCEIHRSPMNSPHKGQWRGALMFSLISAWINGWVNIGEAVDLRRHRAHHGVTLMWLIMLHMSLTSWCFPTAIFQKLSQSRLFIQPPRLSHMAHHGQTTFCNGDLKYDQSQQKTFLYTLYTLYIYFVFSFLFQLSPWDPLNVCHAITNARTNGDEDNTSIFVLLG